jgi:flagellar hook-associated protein 2
VDDAETGTWTGSSAVTTDGNYLGSVNKTYSFTVMNSGTVNAGGTAGTMVLRWTDSTGSTGTVSVADSTQTYSVDQGLKLKFSAGSLNSGDNFQVNVFAPDQQQGQDKGLAQAAKAVHYGFADKDQTPVTNSDGSFSYNYGGVATTVSVSSGSTLTQLVNLINGDTNNPGVTASIINDGMGLPTSFRLVLTGNQAGAQYQITRVSHTLTAFNDDGTLGGGFDVSQLATNSMVKVDGYPAQSGIYLQRSSNQITDVIKGVSLNLADAGSAVITVSTNTSAVAGKIQALINAVNYTQSFIRDATKYDPSTKESGILLGNYSYYIIKSRVDSALNSSVTGLVDGTDPYLNLAQIGIHTDPDNEGTWVIDSTTLTNALNSNPDAVANVFINNTDRGTKGAAKRMFDEMTALTDSKSGPLNVLINNYNDIITNIDKKIDSETKRLELYRQTMKERFARMETTLSTLNGQSKALESAIAQLTSKSS